MNLKTDYKDDMFEGSRRWNLTQNNDGTYTISDSTSYTQKGDRFGCNDINATNKAVNRLNHTVQISLSAEGWLGDAAPYSQTVSAEEITEESEPILVKILEDGAEAAVQKAYNKAFGIVASGTAVTGNGTVTFKVYKKPVTDVMVGLKGV